MVHYVQNSHLLHTTEEEAGSPPGAGNGPKFGRGFSENRQKMQPRTFQHRMFTNSLLIQTLGKKVNDFCDRVIPSTNHKTKTLVSTLAKLKFSFQLFDLTVNVHSRGRKTPYFHQESE